MKEDAWSAKQRGTLKREVPLAGKEYRKPELIVHGELKDTTGYSGKPTDK